MKRFDMETAVGLFVLLGILCMAYLSVKLGKLEIVGGNDVPVTAEFSSVAGLRPGASVEIAGVEVGKVDAVTLRDYQALVRMKIRRDVKLQDDSIASIKTSGLIGEKYVQISPGASEKYIGAGGRIRDTESAIDIEALISKYAFGKI